MKHLSPLRAYNNCTDHGETNTYAGHSISKNWWYIRYRTAIKIFLCDRNTTEPTRQSFLYFCSSHIATNRSSLEGACAVRLEQQCSMWSDLSGSQHHISETSCYNKMKKTTNFRASAESRNSHFSCIPTPHYQWPTKMHFPANENWIITFSQLGHLILISSANCIHYLDLCRSVGKEARNKLLQSAVLQLGMCTVPA